MTWWGRLLRRSRVEAALDAELRDHLERQVADYVAGGLSEPEARRRARLEFGGLDQVKELCRDARGTRLVEDLAQDIRYGVRVLRKAPTFTAVAVTTLALGIGANMAVFALIDALLLRPLPVHRPEQLVVIGRLQGTEPADHFSYPHVQYLAAQASIFSGVCGVGSDTLHIGPPETIEPVGAAWVSAHCFATLGVAPLAGRLLGPDDDRPGAPPAAVISERYWKRRFGGDPGIIGRTVPIEGIPVPVVGIAPPRFLGVIVGEAADVTLTVNARAHLLPGGDGFLDASARWLRILARPRDGVSGEQVAPHLGALWQHFLETTASPLMSPAGLKRLLTSTPNVQPGTAGASSVRDRFRRPLLASMTLVVAVLLMACVNVANLLLARAATRDREVALRLAIGARRARIVRQLLIESALLGAAGVAGAALISWFGSRALVEMLGTSMRGPDAARLTLDLSFDWRMFAFTSGVALLTTLAFGLLPALRTVRSASMSTINATSLRVSDSRRRVASVLVTTQVALSLLLLIGAGLFARTLHNLRTLDRGFRHEGVILVRADARRSGHSGPTLQAFNREMFAFAERLPGVRIASVSTITPLQGGGISMPVLLNGQRITDDEVYFNNVGPGFFDALQTRVVRGRDFTIHDQVETGGVAIVNEAFVRTYIPAGNPLGQRITVAKSPELEIVGVVEDAVYETLRAAPPATVYVPFFRGGNPGRNLDAALVLFAPGALEQTAAALRAEFQPKLGGRPLQVITLSDQLESSLARERLMASVATVFGALALLLAAVGLYGLLAYFVARRTQEIGIRVALGARRTAVLRLVLGDAARMLAAGIAIGVPAAWALSRFVSSMLYGLTPTDATTLAGATAVLGITALAAAIVPARRALTVDPVTTLRAE